MGGRVDGLPVTPPEYPGLVLAHRPGLARRGWLPGSGGGYAESAPGSPAYVVRRAASLLGVLDDSS